MSKTCSKSYQIPEVDIDAEHRKVIFVIFSKKMLTNLNPFIHLRSRKLFNSTFIT